MIEKEVILVKKLVPMECEIIKVPLRINFVRQGDKYVPTKIISVPKCIITKSDIIEIPYYIPKIN